MIDPFQEHPEHPPLKKNCRNFLTRQEIFVIINEEMLRIEKLDVPTWGYTKDDLYEVAENIVDEITKATTNEQITIK